MKTKNTFWYLGFLSLLSLLYFVEGKIGFLGFLGFLSYFSVYRMSDERIEINIGKATKNAFLFTVFFGSATITYGYLFKNIEIMLPSFIVLLGGALLICVISLFYYDKVNR